MINDFSETFIHNSLNDEHSEYKNARDMRIRNKRMCLYIRGKRLHMVMHTYGVIFKEIHTRKEQIQSE